MKSQGLTFSQMRKKHELVDMKQGMNIRFIQDGKTIKVCLKGGVN